MAEQLNPNPILVNQKTADIKSICFYSFNQQDALSHLRLIGPARHLGLVVIHGVENGQVLVDRAKLGDVIVFQRDFPRAIDSYELIISHARKNQIPIILDIDDMLFELPEDHPDRLKHVFTWTLLPTFLALQEVDLVTVTTKPLQDYVLNYNKNVIILPNYLDDLIWKLKPPSRNKNPDEKITIGYMGGLSHQSDLALLLPVFHKLIHAFPGRLEFNFRGTQPPKEFLDYPFVHWNDQIIWNYQDFAAQFQTQSADIFISPLANNYFNNCKSSIKYLEYACLGVPTIFSRVDPYTSVITHGVNGLLASTADEWEDCLVEMIENPGLRYNLAVNAQADLRSNWLLSKNAPRWLSAFQQAYEVKSSKPYNEAYDSKMIKNLSRQIVAWHADWQQQLVELNTALTAITSSNTWKLAQRFHQFRELVAPPNSRREKLLSRLLGLSTPEGHIKAK